MESCEPGGMSDAERKEADGIVRLAEGEPPHLAYVPVQGMLAQPICGRAKKGASRFWIYKNSDDPFLCKSILVPLDSKLC